MTRIIQDIQYPAHSHFQSDEWWRDERKFYSHSAFTVEWDQRGRIVQKEWWTQNFEMDDITFPSLCLFGTSSFIHSFIHPFVRSFVHSFRLDCCVVFLHFWLIRMNELAFNWTVLSLFIFRVRCWWHVFYPYTDMHLHI